MADSVETTSVKKSKAPLIVSGIIIIGLVAAYFFIPGVRDFLTEAWTVLTSNDEERITNWVSDF